MTRAAKNGARESILSSLRSSLRQRGEDDLARRQAVEARLNAPQTHTLPARALRPKEALVHQFGCELEGQGAHIIPVAGQADIAGIILDYLRKEQLPLALRMGADMRLQQIDWRTTPDITLSYGPTRGDDLVGLSYAFGGAAETGSLFLVSGPQNPTTLNFLADTHIVLIDEETIAGPYEAVWQALRMAQGAQGLPRAVNLIGGPSRTADIEQTIVKGAHGPRRLAVLIVKSCAR